MLNTYNTYRMFLSEDRVPYLKKDKEFPGNDVLKSPDRIVQMMKDTFQADILPEEHVWVMAFDSRMHVLGVFEISCGTATMTLTTPREVFMRALLIGAVSVVVLHNHPSMDTTPSKEDIKLAKKLVKAGKLLHISMLDFIIIGEDYCSFLGDNIIKMS